jgi:hypothetical protein
VNAGVECVFDEAQDRRRKAIKRKAVEDAEFHRKLLEELLISLRHSKAVDVRDLVDYIRTGASLQEISTHIEALLEKRHADNADGSTGSRESSTELEAALMQIDSLEIPEQSHKRHKALSIEEMNNLPISSVPAKPWTTVTDRDEVVSELISLWCTWNQPFQMIDVDILTREMRSGDLKSPFCSPLLINAILAAGSVSLDSFVSGTFSTL